MDRITPILAVVGLASSVFAQTSRLVFEASRDGGTTWARDLVASPLDFIDIRVRCEYVQGAAAR